MTLLCIKTRLTSCQYADFLVLFVYDFRFSFRITSVWPTVKTFWCKLKLRSRTESHLPNVFLYFEVFWAKIFPS